MSRGEWNKGKPPGVGLNTIEDFRRKQEVLLDSIRVIEVLDRIRNFRRLPFRSMAFDEIAKALEHVVNYADPISGEPTSVFPFSTGHYSVGDMFYRVRIDRPLGTVDDCWCPPARIMQANRLNRPGKPALYTSPKNFTVAMDELQVRVGQTVSLITYRAKVKVLVMIIGVEPDYSHLNDEQTVKQKMLTDFLYDEFTRDVARGSEHRFQISNLIADMTCPVLPGFAGWCYPSTMRGGEHVNVYFVGDTVHDYLELLGVLDATLVSNTCPPVGGTVLVRSPSPSK